MLQVIRNYVWEPYGEFIRFALIVALGVVFTAIAKGTETELLDFGWWKGVLIAAGVAAAQYVQGKLPPTS
jgi:hypothetical protein